MDFTDALRNVTGALEQTFSPQTYLRKKALAQQAQQQQFQDALSAYNTFASPEAQNAQLQLKANQAYMNRDNTDQTQPAQPAAQPPAQPQSSIDLPPDLQQEGQQLTALADKIQGLDQYGASPMAQKDKAQLLQNFNMRREMYNQKFSAYEKQKADERALQIQDRADKREQRLQESVIDVSKPLDPSTVDYYATQSLNGDNSWQVGLARGKVGQRLIAAVKDRIPQLAKEQGITPQDASANKALRESLSKALNDRQKYVATGTQFVTNFNKQSDLVDKYLKPGVGGQSPVINRWLQAGRKSVMGDSDVTNLDTAIRGLAREHQRIVTGLTSNAQLLASAQQTADELLNRDMSEEQIKGTLNVMREEAKNALDSGNQEVDLLKTQISHIGKKTTDGKPIQQPSSPSGVMSLDDYLKSKGH